MADNDILDENKTDAPQNTENENRTTANWQEILQSYDLSEQEAAEQQLLEPEKTIVSGIDDDDTVFQNQSEIPVPAQDFYKVKPIKKKKGGTIALVIILVILLAVGTLLGLHFTGIINLPFLSVGSTYERAERDFFKSLVSEDASFNPSDFKFDMNYEIQAKKGLTDALGMTGEFYPITLDLQSNVKDKEFLLELVLKSGEKTYATIPVYYNEEKKLGAFSFKEVLGDKFVDVGMFDDDLLDDATTKSTLSTLSIPLDEKSRSKIFDIFVSQYFAVVEKQYKTIEVSGTVEGISYTNKAYEITLTKDMLTDIIEKSKDLILADKELTTKLDEAFKSAQYSATTILNLLVDTVKKAEFDSIVYTTIVDKDNHIIGRKLATKDATALDYIYLEKDGKHSLSLTAGGNSDLAEKVTITASGTQKDGKYTGEVDFGTQGIVVKYNDLIVSKDKVSGLVDLSIDYQGKKIDVKYDFIEEAGKGDFTFDLAIDGVDYFTMKAASKISNGATITAPDESKILDLEDESVNEEVSTKFIEFITGLTTEEADPKDLVRTIINVLMLSSQGEADIA